MGFCLVSRHFQTSALKCEKFLIGDHYRLATDPLGSEIIVTMSISSMLPNRGIVVSGGSALVCAPRGPWKPLPQVSISSRRVSWRCRPLQKLAGRGLRISACVAPSCQSAEVSASVIERVGFGEVEFGSSALQVVKEGLVFQQARSPELIRAAAYLRAVSFYTIPEGRSEEAIQLHRKMKAADEFSNLKSKVAGLQQGYKRIVCIIALYPLLRLPDSTVVKLHPALKVTLNGEEHVLVGSLDLNQGLRVLPGEPAGIKSEMGPSFVARTASLSLSTPSRSIQGLGRDRERGYLSNVCVAPLMRQRGIGMALLQQAQNMSQLWGVTNLYVHAVATNEAAVKLYSKGGFADVATKEAPVKLSSTAAFTLEKEAAISIARRQARPSRLLLYKFI